jgi:Protein of unknown function, DUF624
LDTSQGKVNSRLNALKRTLLDVHNWLLVLVAINILWTIMSLTILLLPPATAALYEVAYRAYRGHGPTIPDYLAGVRHWLFKSWIWGIALGVFGSLAIFALRFYQAQAGTLGFFLSILMAMLIMLMAAVQFYFWAYMVIQDQPSLIGNTRNALFTVLGDPLLILLNGGAATVFGIISLLLIVPFVLIAPVSIAFLSVYSLVDWLDNRGILQKNKGEV